MKSATNQDKSPRNSPRREDETFPNIKRETQNLNIQTFNKNEPIDLKSESQSRDLYTEAMNLIS